LKQQQESEQTGQPPSLSQQETPLVAQPAPRQPESPLQAHLAGRRKAPEQVRFIAPRMFKAETKAPVTPPVLSRQKARTAPPAAAPPPAKPLDLLPAPLPALSRQEAPVSPPSPAIEMPVARPPEHISASSQPGGAQVLSAIQQPTLSQSAPQPTALAEAAQQQRVEAALPATRSTAGNVVQRLWDEHSPPSSASSNPSSGTSGDQDSGGQPALDLDKLAEDVFPIVKRLIEIESERSSGYLR
jgi:hypothetical protein